MHARWAAPVENENEPLELLSGPALDPTIAPDLAEGRAAYAALYRETYGQDEPVAETGSGNAGVQLAGISRSKLYKLIKSGDLSIVEIGSVTLIPVENLEQSSRAAKLTGSDPAALGRGSRTTAKNLRKLSGCIHGNPRISVRDVFGMFEL